MKWKKFVNKFIRLSLQILGLQIFCYIDLKKVDKHFSLYISVLMVVAYDHVVFLPQSDRIHVALALNNSIWLVYYADLDDQVK